MTSFGVRKELLLRQYRFGTEQSLARAGFLNTNEIVTVQAFVLFLVCVRRHDDTRFVWSLTGLALRIAQSLGLHRDGSKFGLSPFDTEMRRRLWWVSKLNLISLSCSYALKTTWTGVQVYPQSIRSCFESILIILTASLHSRHSCFRRPWIRSFHSRLLLRYRISSVYQR